MKLSDDRYDEIISGTERIKQEKPYADRDDAIAALDWITAATDDLRRAQHKLKPAEILLIADLERHIAALDSLHQSIQSRMAANDQHIPGRHGGEATDALD